MADFTTSVNVDELRNAQARLNENAQESFKQYQNADTSVQEHVGNEGDGALGGKLGQFVNNQWADDTREAINRYRNQANHLLDEALTSITTNAQNLSAETESVYK